MALRPGLFGVLLFFVGALIAFLGRRIGLARPEPLGALIAGVGIVLLGLDGVVTGQTYYRISNKTRTRTGMSARIQGTIFAFLGLAVCAASVMELAGAGNLDAFLRVPSNLGYIVIGVGALGMLIGIIRLLDRPDERDSIIMRNTFMRRLIGLIVVVTSTILVGVGVLIRNEPGGIRSFAEKWLGPIFSQ